MKKIISIALIKMQNYRCYLRYSKQFKGILNKLHIPHSPVEGENEYLKKWRVLNKRIEKNSYRIFSTFCGHTPDIVPEDIGHSYIEKVLNPTQYVFYYSDKNLYDKYILKESLPTTILRRINGGHILANDYTIIENITNIYRYISERYSKCPEYLILKPSVDSDSGEGVMKFILRDNKYQSVSGNVILDMNFLINYRTDFLLQEAIQQHDDLSRFCHSSVNTIRIATYRSVKTDEVFVLGTIMRIGKAGHIVDNDVEGRFVGINPLNGLLNNYVCNRYGNRQNEWNGVRFDTQKYFIPCWEKIMEFAKYIGRQNLHCRLLALDLTLDKTGTPRLIEYNVKYFSYWYFMYSGQLPFGKFTDEIIEYCKTHAPSRMRWIY